VVLRQGSKSHKAAGIHQLSSSHNSWSLTARAQHAAMPMIGIPQQRRSLDRRVQKTMLGGYAVKAEKPSLFNICY
jgi:hypothetical protein